MKRVIILFIIASFSLYSQNSDSKKLKGNITMELKGNKVSVTLEPGEGEHVTTNFLALDISSDHYDFIFSGYPEDVVTDEYGTDYYEGVITLEGRLVLKEGVKKGEYEVDVTLEYQTCSDEGICNMPVSITRTLKSSSAPVMTYIIIGLAIIFVILAVMVIKKRINE